MAIAIGSGLSPEYVLAGGGAPSPSSGRWTITGQPVSVPIVSAGAGVLNMSGRAISPVVIPGKGTIATVGKPVAPTVIPGKGALAITGEVIDIGTFTPLSLGSACIEWWDFRTSTYLTLGGGNAISNVVGRKSVYALVQATGSLQAIWDAAGFAKFDVVDDYFTLTLTSAVTQGQIYYCTPYGWYKSGIGNWSVDVYKISGADATQLVFVDAAVITAEQRTALETYLGATSAYLITKTTDTTIYSRVDNTTDINYTLVYTGANAVTYSKASAQAGETVDVGVQGLTAPLHMVVPTALEVDSALQELHCDANQFSGTFPSLTGLTALRRLYCDANQFSGTFPSLTGLTALQILWCNNNQFSGTFPSLTGLTALQILWCNSNQFSDYTPSTVSTTLTNVNMSSNLFTATAINAILADFVAAGAVSGLLNLAGTGNAAPTGQGIIDKATLQGLGWSVSTN